jgi:hypothetical protein
MRKVVTTAFLASSLALGTGFTDAARAAGSTAPTQSGASEESGASTMSDAQIRQQLEAQGYTVQSLKHERDYVEAKVIKGGQLTELRVDPQSGTMSKAPEDGQDDYE